MIDWVISLNWLWPFIFIGWGGLAPQENPLQVKFCQNSSILLGLGVHQLDRSGLPVRPVWPLPDRL
jgi:hypothetical protein